MNILNTLLKAAVSLCLLGGLARASNVVGAPLPGAVFKAGATILISVNTTTTNPYYANITSLDEDHILSSVPFTGVVSGTTAYGYVPVTFSGPANIIISLVSAPGTALVTIPINIVPWMALDSPQAGINFMAESGLSIVVRAAGLFPTIAGSGSTTYAYITGMYSIPQFGLINQIMNLVYSNTLGAFVSSQALAFGANYLQVSPPAGFNGPSFLTVTIPGIGTEFVYFNITNNTATYPPLPLP